MFRKTASVEHIGTLVLENGALSKTAAEGSAQSDTNSVFLSRGGQTIDVQAAINNVADKYKLSRDPTKYSYEVVKAVKSGGLNRNFDGFPRSEQLRYLLKFAKVTYRTFEGKPHHINHKVDIDGDARGFILDAAYNDLSQPRDNCPLCNATTKLASERSSDGMHCRKCGHIVKDEFVECLLAVDAAKDPDLVAHIRSGVLNATSMGCSCEETECNVCNNIARSASEFCKHVAEEKGNWFKRSISRTAGDARTASVTYGPWKLSNIRELRSALKTCGYNPAAAETTLRVVAGDTEFAISGEHCRYVGYDELSRVAKPAETTALTVEFLELTRRAAVTNALVFEKLAQEGKIKMSKFFVVAVDGSHTDTRAATTLNEAVALLQPDATSKLTYVAVEAPDEDAARKLYLAHEKSAQAVPASAMPAAAAPPAPAPMPAQHESSVTVEVPDGMKVQMVDGSGNPVTPPEDPAQEMGGDVMAPQAPGDEMPPSPSGAPMEAPGMTPESMGVLPPKSAAWSGKHDGFVVDVGEQFTVVASAEDDEPLFMVRHAAPIRSEVDQLAQAAHVQTVVAQHGLLGAARKLNATFSASAADATGIGDMKGAPKTIGDTPLSRVDPVAEPESDGLTEKRDGPAHVNVNRDEAPVNIARDRIIAERYAAAQEAAVKRAEQAGFERAVEQLTRALTIVAKRAALNIEESSLKAAMFTALTEEHAVGKTASGEDILTVPMTDDVAMFHIESAWLASAETEAKQMVQRAALLAKSGDAYLKTAEADLAAQSVPMPRISSNSLQSVAESSAQARTASAEEDKHIFGNSSEVAREVRASMSRMNFDGGRRTVPVNSPVSGRASGRQ